jgi:hypothetical protein
MKQVAPMSATAAVLALAVTLAASGLDPASGARASEACPSASGQEIVLTVPMPRPPGFLLLRQKTLWVAVPSASPPAPGSVVRVDPVTGRIQGTFSLPVNPYRLAYGFGSLWVTGEVGRQQRRYQGAVLRVDPRSGRILRTIRGPRLFGAALATTSDGVWVGGGDVAPEGQMDNTVARWAFKIDPRRNEVVRSVHLAPTTIIDLVGDGRFLWAAGWGAVVKLSPMGRLLFQQRFDGSGWAMAVVPGAVWVAQPFFGNRRDLRTQKPARRLLRVATSGTSRVTVLELTTQPADVSAAAGATWVGANGGLVRVDATEVPPTLTKVAADLRPNRIEAFPGGVWVDELRSNVLSKIC